MKLASISAFGPLVVGLLVLPACPLLDVEGNVQDACVTYSGLPLAANGSGTATVEQSFTVNDLQSFKDLADQDFTLRFTHGTATATSGISDFTFVQEAKLTVTSGAPTSALPMLDIFDCDDCATGSDTLDVAAETAADPSPYVDSGSIVVTIDLTGTAPAVDWTMDVAVCLTGSGSYEVNE